MEQEKKDQYYTGEAGLSPIPMTVNSAPVKATDKGKIRANAVEAMHHYANHQMETLKRQAELIMKQVREIEERVRVSELIYQAEMRFVPVIGKTYYLYERDEGQYMLSLIGPHEWGRSRSFSRYVSTVKLLADHSWDVLEMEA